MFRVWKLIFKVSVGEGEHTYGFATFRHLASLILQFLHFLSHLKSEEIKINEVAVM